MERVRFGLLLLLLCTACSSETPTARTLGDDLQQALDAIVEELGAPGATMAVALPGEPLWTGATGMADRENAIAMTPAHLMGIGSITKTYTAAVVLLLQEEGQLSVSDTLEQWYPGFPRGEQITLRHLLSHTTGIYDVAYHGDVLSNAAKDWDPNDLVALAAAEPPEFDPGVDYAYSNTNFLLLGLVVEAVTGNSWESEVRRRLLDPLELGATHLPTGEPVPVEDVAQGYFVNAVWTTAISPSTGWAAGGMIADVSDLVRWLDLLLYGDVLTVASREAMKTPFELAGGQRTRYGLGLRLKKTEHGDATKLGHGGDAIIYRADMYHRTVEGITVVALVNGYPHSARVIADVAWDLVAPP